MLAGSVCCMEDRKSSIVMEILDIGQESILGSKYNPENECRKKYGIMLELWKTILFALQLSG